MVCAWCGWCACGFFFIVAQQLCVSPTHLHTCTPNFLHLSAKTFTRLCFPHSRHPFFCPPCLALPPNPTTTPTTTPPCTPQSEPRATDYIPAMIDTISRIIDNGHAYALGDGDVYFDVASLPGEHCRTAAVAGDGCTSSFGNRAAGGKTTPYLMLRNTTPQQHASRLPTTPCTHTPVPFPLCSTTHHQATASCQVAPRRTTAQGSVWQLTGANAALLTLHCGRAPSLGSPPGPAPGALGGLGGTLSAAA